MRTVFLHNPKAGGSAIDATMRQHFSAERSSLLVSSPWAATEGIEDQPDAIDYISGHFGHGALGAFGADVDVITNFRNPVDRIVSIFDYWRNNFEEGFCSANPESGPALVRSLAFADFVRTTHPKLSLFLDNFHARQLLSDGWTARNISWSDRFVLRRRVSKLKWFYVCELPDLSRAFLSRVFPRLDHAIERVNATSYGGRAKTRPSRGDVRTLIERNRADVFVYGYAVQRLARRLGT